MNPQRTQALPERRLKGGPPQKCEKKRWRPLRVENGDSTGHLCLEVSLGFEVSSFNLENRMQAMFQLQGRFSLFEIGITEVAAFKYQLNNVVLTQTR